MYLPLDPYRVALPIPGENRRAQMIAEVRATARAKRRDRRQARLQGLLSAIR
jgi:hypothetical protein